MKLHHFQPHPGKIFLATSGKIHYCLPLEKILPTTMTTLKDKVKPGSSDTHPLILSLKFPLIVFNPSSIVSQKFGDSVTEVRRIVHFER